MTKDHLVSSLLKMRRLAAPGPNLFGITPLDEVLMPDKLTNIFRMFSPIKPEKGRKPNCEYGFNFDKFEDTLSDSPITISNKLGMNWDKCNLHVIVQSSVCNFRCWYCYVEYKYLTGKSMVQLSAEEVFERFLHLREEYKNKSIILNVLRISGGEPMLVPDLTLSCLKLTKKMGLEKEICIKTETNLSPLFEWNGQPLAENWADLREFSSFNNFIVHPTVHGISGSNLHNNSAIDPELFEMTVEGISTLLKYKVDFYPSFGANTNCVEDLRPFFIRMKGLNPNLPLRFAVRSFSFDYDAVVGRGNGNKAKIHFDPKKVISEWDSLLREEYGVGYGDIPRYRIPL